MDLSNMSVGDLRNLQEQIKQEMKKREVQEAVSYTHLTLPTKRIV